MTLLKMKMWGGNMAICLIKASLDLGAQFVLTPERYNPRRRMEVSDDDGILLSELIVLSNDTISPKQAANKDCIQINTSDAMEGCLRISSQKESLKSNKKILSKGDVIISRLRPYLRQVAYVDIDTERATFCASTEFYVLKSLNEDSIAYLVPFLLSDVAQTVFTNAVEGSQHPRFKEEDLLNLVVPRAIYESRKEISTKVETSIRSFRHYEEGMSEEIKNINSTLKVV